MVIDYLLEVKNAQFPELATFVAEGIPREELCKLVKSVIEVYKDNAEEDESMKDVIERIGVSDFVEVLAPYSQDAADEELDFGTSTDSQESLVDSLVSEETSTLEDEDMGAKREENLDLDELSLDELETEEIDPKLEAVDVDNLAGLEEGPVMESDIKDLDSINDIDTDIEVINDEHAEVAMDDVDIDEVSIDELDELKLDGEPSLDDDLISQSVTIEEIDEPELEAKVEEVTPELSDDLDSVQEVALEGSHEDDLAMDLENIEEINEDPEAIGSEDLSDLKEESLDETADFDMEISAEPELIEDPDLAGLTEETQLVTADESPVEEDLTSEQDISFDEPEKEELGVSESDDLEFDADMSMDDIGDDEVNSDATEILESDEEGFEEKLANSIEEESKLLQGIEKDENEDVRASALDFIGEEASEEHQEIDVDLNLNTEEESVSNITDYSEGGANRMSKNKVALSLTGFEIDAEETAHMIFENGVRLSFDLSDLDAGDYRTLSILGDSVSIAKTNDGYHVELSGVSMFYPMGLNAQVS